MVDLSVSVASPCPACGVQGATVGTQTVKALVAVSLRLVVAEQYRFCATPACPVVYFAIDQSHHFTFEQLREPVYQKQPHDPLVRVCYCFGYTYGTIQHATPADHAAMLADITAGIRANQCACDLRNPQGACCLGNVRRLVAQDLP